MEIQQSIEKLALKRGRATAKSDAIYDSSSAAQDEAGAMSSAKDAKAFDKAKEKCLASVEAGKKATADWQKEMREWGGAINDLIKEIAAENEKIAQQEKEADAVNKAIDEINAEIKAYNADLLLGENDPRARPYVAKRPAGPKLAATTAGLAAATALANRESECFNNQKTWLAKPINELKKTEDTASKAKFTPPKK